MDKLVSKSVRTADLKSDANIPNLDTPKIALSRRKESFGVALTLSSGDIGSTMDRTMHRETDDSSFVHFTPNQELTAISHQHSSEANLDNISALTAETTIADAIHLRKQSAELMSVVTYVSLDMAGNHLMPNFSAHLLHSDRKSSANDNHRSRHPHTSALASMKRHIIPQFNPKTGQYSTTADPPSELSNLSIATKSRIYSQTGEVSELTGSWTNIASALDSDGDSYYGGLDTPDGHDPHVPLRHKAMEMPAQHYTPLKQAMSAASTLSIWKQFRVVCHRNPPLWSLAIIVFLFILTGYIPAVFFPGYAARKLANCDTTGDPSCKYAYGEYQLWNCASLSIGGIIAFSFVGLMGRASDAFGRKPLFIVSIIASMAAGVAMLFTNSVWWYFGLRVLSGFNGSNSSTPVINAYIADILSPPSRMMGFGLLYAIAGFGCLTGSALAVVIARVWNIEMEFSVMTALYCLQLCLVVCLLPETLRKHLRQPMVCTNCNPFRPLLHIRSNPVICYICIILFLVSLSETGVSDTVMAYILDTMDTQNEQTANLYCAIFLIINALGVILSQSLVLPKLRQMFTDWGILLIGTLLLVISMLFCALISWLPHLTMVCISAFLISTGSITFPAVSGILTRYLDETEQGLGFGTAFAYRGLTYAIAPFAFGYMYLSCKQIDCAFIPFVVAAVIATAAIPFIAALRREIQKCEHIALYYS